MLNNYIRYILLFFLLVFVQICILNKIHLFGVITPLIYVYFILKLPTNISLSLVLLWSFFLGFFLDFFSYSMGLNMIAATFTGFLRSYLLRMHTSRDIVELLTPSIQSMDTFSFMRYAFWMILLHHALLFMVDAGSFYDAGMLALKIAGSSGCTLILVMGCEALNTKKQ